MSKFYQVDCEVKNEFGYECVDVFWSGVETVAKKGTFLFRVWNLYGNGFAIDNDLCDAYDLGGAVDTALERLAKEICKRKPRAKVTLERIQQNWN